MLAVGQTATRVVSMFYTSRASIGSNSDWNWLCGAAHGRHATDRLERYCVRSTSRLSVPPSEDVTFTRAGVIANVVVSLPALSVPSGSFGLPAALSVGAPTWSLEVAFTVRVLVPML